jgi:hypothetical protein
VTGATPAGCSGTPDLVGTCTYTGGGGGGGGGTCFLAGTLVLTPTGYQDISDLKEGDKVISYDELTKSNVIAEVKLYRKYLRDHYYLLNNSIRVTKEHRFAVERNNKLIWVPVIDLKIGDKFVSDQNNLIELTAKEKISDVSVEVFNPALSSPHTYYVIMNGVPVRVHNEKCETC